MNKNQICIIGTNEKIGSLLSKKGYLIFQYGRLTKPSIDFTSEKFSIIVKIIKNFLISKIENLVVGLPA